MVLLARRDAPVMVLCLHVLRIFVNVQLLIKIVEDPRLYVIQTALAKKMSILNVQQELVLVRVNCNKYNHESKILFLKKNLLNLSVWKSLSAKCACPVEL